jgi:hypothetical protein
MNRYLAKLGSLDEKTGYPSNPQNPQNPRQRGLEGFEGSLSSAFLRSATPPTELPEAPKGGYEPAGDALAVPYAAALAALRAKCPAYVPEDRWRQAVADTTTFVSEWGAEAQGLDWPEHALFGPHPTGRWRASIVWGWSGS